MNSDWIYYLRQSLDEYGITLSHDSMKFFYHNYAECDVSYCTNVITSPETVISDDGEILGVSIDLFDDTVMLLETLDYLQAIILSERQLHVYGDILKMLPRLSTIILCDDKEYDHTLVAMDSNAEHVYDADCRSDLMEIDMYLTGARMYRVIDY